MADSTRRRRSDSRHPMDQDRVQYLSDLVAAFIGLLAAELVALLLPWTWSRKVRV